MIYGYEASKRKFIYIAHDELLIDSGFFLFFQLNVFDIIIN